MFELAGGILLGLLALIGFIAVMLVLADSTWNHERWACQELRLREREQREQHDTSVLRRRLGYDS